MSYRRRAGRSAGSVGFVLLLGVVLALSGCGDGDGSSEGGRAVPGSAAPTTYRVSAPPADPRTAEGVAVLALTQIFTWRPAAEASGASMQRARQWLGPRLRQVLDQPATNVPMPKQEPQWTDWAAKGAIIKAFAFASGEQAPAPDPGTAVSTTDTASPTDASGPSRTGSSSPVSRRELVKVGIEQTVVYPDGRSEQLPPTTVIATVVRTSDGWLLDDYS